jgi:NDP-sugar pyrophosphorylase family protein
MQNSGLMFRGERQGGGRVRGIVLAGSYDRGDGPVTPFLRRPLLPLAHTPLICYPLQWLRDGGVPDATICASGATEEIRAAFGAGASLGMRLAYCAEDHPRGPAGCVRDAGLPTDARTFVVVEGSMIPSIDLPALIDAHRGSGALVTTVVEVERRRARPAAQLRLPGGVYVFDREALSRISPKGFQDIKQGLLEKLHAEHARVHAYEVAGISPRILDYASYSSASRWIVGSAEKRSQFLSAYVPVGEGLHHPTVHVSPSARLIGPVLLGAGARIEPHAVVVGPTSIGAGAIVGSMAVVSRSVLLPGCTVGEGAHLDSSLLADGGRVESWAELVDTVQLESAGGATRRTPPRAVVASIPARAAVGGLPAPRLVPERVR